MKKYVKSVFVAAIVAVVGYNVYQSQSAFNGMSEFALANVEALADGESNGDLYCPYTGYGCQVNYTNGTTEIFWGKSPNYHP